MGCVYFHHSEYQWQSLVMVSVCMLNTVVLGICTGCGQICKGAIRRVSQPCGVLKVEARLQHCDAINSKSMVILGKQKLINSM